jgi:acyl-CoA thioesterase-1
VTGYSLLFLVSGDALPVGLALLCIGAVLGFWRHRPGVAVALLGIALAFAAAVPLSPLLYGLLLLVVILWAVRPSRRRARHLAVTWVVVAVAVAVFAANWLQGSFGTRPAPRTPPLFVLGDSLSAGLGGDKTDTWPSLLAKRTDRSIRNLATPGARLRDGIVQAEAVPPGKSVILIELGGNDLLGGATVHEFTSSLRALLESVSRSDRSVFMFELPLPPLHNSFGRAQRRLCADYGVALIPRRVLAGAIALPGHTTDGLHLSPEGHRWLARRVTTWF